MGPERYDWLQDHLHLRQDTARCCLFRLPKADVGIIAGNLLQPELYLRSWRVYMQKQGLRLQHAPNADLQTLMSIQAAVLVSCAHQGCIAAAGDARGWSKACQ